MTELQLLEAIGMLDEETVLDAEQTPAKGKLLSLRAGRLTRQISAIAACLLLFCGTALILRTGGSKFADHEPTAPDMAATGAAGGAAATTTSPWADAPSAEEPNATMATAEATTYATTAAVATTAATTTAMSAATTGAMTTTITDNFPIGGSVTVPPESVWVYTEDFNSYGDTPLALAPPTVLNWTKLTVSGNEAYSESDVAFALRDGRLYFDNLDTAEDTFGDGTLTRGKDAYYTIDLLNDDYMKPVVAGKYTLQYDLEYVNASDVKRYAALITELSADRQCYSSFHLRIGGTANHEAHFYGAWKSFSYPDPATDLNPAADDPTGAEGTPLLQKLLGLDIAQHGNEMNLADIRLTVRLQWEPKTGHHVYVKTATMTDFVKVSAPDPRAVGTQYIGGWEGYAVALKIGGAVEGYLDNILLWTGWGEQPASSAERYQPTP